MKEISKEQNEEMIATAKRSISDLDTEIKKLQGLRDTWVKICGKVEGELYGRILP
jgi:CCR4-NOT transcriptional regulation complex NOT5 subunit